MTPNGAIHWAVIETGATADAPQHRLVLPSEQPRAAVIQQHHMIRLRPLHIAWPAWPRIQRRISGELLPRCAAGQYPQEHGKIVQGGHDLFDPGSHNMYPWQTTRQITVPLIGDDDIRARFRDQKVGSRNPYIRRNKTFAEHTSCFVNQGFPLGHPVGITKRTVVFMKKVCNLLTGFMDCRRDDVAGSLSRQLHDVLAQIGLDDRYAGLLQHRVEMHFLGHH